MPGTQELADEAAAFVAQYLGRAEPLAWQGIVYARARGGLSALGLVKDARKAFAQSIAIDGWVGTDIARQFLLSSAWLADRFRRR